MKSDFSFSQLLVRAVIVTVFSCSAFAQGPSDWREAVRENLYKTYEKEVQELGLEPKSFYEGNLEAFANLANTKEVRKGTRVGHVTKEQADELIELARNHSVVGSEAQAKYDPEGNRGFCYGRATFLHLELLRRGVQKEAIKKVFLVGPMKTGETTWQFHVATAVRGPKGEWFALDPNFPKATGLIYWYHFWVLTSVDKKLRAYISHPSKIGPSAWEYNVQEGGLMDPFYNDYFKDMFETFKQPPVVSYKRTIKSCSKVHAPRREAISSR